MKFLLRVFYTVLVWLTLAVSLWMLAANPALPWAGLLVMSVLPALQRLMAFDSLSVPHHKVRLPRVSLGVLLGMGVVLLTVDGGGAALWLALANLGAFLLDTYWARDSGEGAG